MVPTKEAAPRDARAVEGILKIDEYMAPTPGYVEQVYFYDLAEDSDHRTLVAIKNSDLLCEICLPITDSAGSPQPTP